MMVPVRGRGRRSEVGDEAPRLGTDGLLLTATSLRRRYGDVVAVSDFTTTVRCGEVVTVLGPNGCGKTTSLEMALGLRRRDGGTVRVLGTEPRAHRRELAPYLGVALQGAALHARVRLREQLTYVAAAFDSGDTWRDIVDVLGLGAALDRPYGSLSGGMQRRAVVASALSGSPVLSVLDEPTSGVDLESRLQLWSAVRAMLTSREAGMLVTTHDLTEAEQHADRVIVMDAGRVIAEGSPRQLVRASGLLRVVTLRRRESRAGWGLPAHAGRALVSSPVELTLGFEDTPAAEALVAALRSRQEEVTALPREPTLQDVYLDVVSTGGGPS